MIPGWRGAGASGHAGGTGRAVTPGVLPRGHGSGFAAPLSRLRPFLEQAFTASTSHRLRRLSGETLHGVIQEPLDKIRIGLIKPATVTIRLLLPDTSRPMVLPCRPMT